MSMTFHSGTARCPALGPSAHARACANATAHHAILANRQTENSKPHTLECQSSCATPLHGVRSGRCSSGLVSRRQQLPPASAAHPSGAQAPEHPDAKPSQHTGSSPGANMGTTQYQPQASLSDVLLDGKSVETGGRRSLPFDRSQRFTLLPPLHKELLQLEDSLKNGSIRGYMVAIRIAYMAKSFKNLAQFDPLSLNVSAKLTRAAEAARRNLMHALAAEFMPLLPNVNRPNQLTAALLACSRTGYGWGPTPATEATGGEGELPLAQAVLDRQLQVLNGAAVAGPVNNSAMGEMLIFEGTLDVLATYPPPGPSNPARSFLEIDGNTEVRDAFPILLALVRLRPDLLTDPGAFISWLFPRLDHAVFGDDAALCEVTEALGELAVQAPALRRALEPEPGAVAAWVRQLVGVVQARLEQQEEWELDPWGRSGQGLGVRHTCQLLRGCLGLCESFKGGASSSSSSGSSSGGSGSDGGANGVGVGDGGAGHDPVTRFAADVAAAAGLAASQLERLDFYQLPPPELSEAAYTLARFGYGSTFCYWQVAEAAGSEQGTFATAATPADWARLWRALALVKYQPLLFGELVRRTAADLRAKQDQQYGSATAHDCATLLWSLAVLRCYDKGLVGWLLGRLVQLLQLLPPSGGDVPGGGDAGRGLLEDVSGKGGSVPGSDVLGSGAPGGGMLPGGAVRLHDLTRSLWAVAVMGPGVLAAHCGAVGELLREVAGRWEQGRMGAGEERQQVLRQLRQVQLELKVVQGGQGEGHSGGDNADSSSSSSSSVCVSPRQLRQLLPPELLLQAEEEVVMWEGPGGAGRGAPGRRLQCLRDEVWAVLQGMVEGGQQGQRRTACLLSDTSNTASADPSPAAGNTSSAGAAPIAWGRVASVTPDAALPDSPCCVDFLVEMADGRRLVVEVEGPGQLLGNYPYTGTRTGPAELRRRQLERVLGSGCVVGVCYWKWEDLGGERGRQEAWLGARLAAALRWRRQEWYGSGREDGQAIGRIWVLGAWSRGPWSWGERGMGKRLILACRRERRRRRGGFPRAQQAGDSDGIVGDEGASGA